MSVAVFAGTFDPFTVGHLDITIIKFLSSLNFRFSIDFYKSVLDNQFCIHTGTNQSGMLSVAWPSLINSSLNLISCMFFHP